MKKISILFLCITVILGTAAAFAEIKNPDTYIGVDVNNVRTLDPAVVYDVSGGQKINNMYEKLIQFDGSATDKFVPQLAVEVPTVENGGISADGKTYTFTIREGVKCHGGEILTAEDVEYSIERHMIVDQVSGPSWMMLEALTGEGSTRDADGNIIPGIFEKIMDAVEVDGNKVILHLPKAYPPLLGILRGSWGAIYPKSWAIANGAWDGTLETAANYNNPPLGEEVLNEVANGSGPYKMKSWERSKQFIFERFNDYWGEKPALKNAIMKYVPEWTTRKLMLINGEADYIVVQGDQYVVEMLEVEGLKHYKVPQLSVAAAMFNRNIVTEGNPYIGSGKLDGEGVPPDFFSDANVRKAFLHAFNRQEFAEDVLLNISTVPTNPNVPGLPYAIDVPVYEFDLKKAEEYMKKAWDGQVWKKGFKMIIPVSPGRPRRQAAGLMLAENIASLNPKFQVETVPVEWATYLTEYRNDVYPLFIIGWAADYADPHNFLYTFLHSNGAYGRHMGYKNEEVDKLCAEGIGTTDPAKRTEIYERLQHIWYEDAMGVTIYQDTLYRFYRDWVQGFVANPMDSYAAEWLYRLSKEEK
jgi:peptide/nickel transport system substrate-binding protein